MAHAALLRKIASLLLLLCLVLPLTKCSPKKEAPVAVEPGVARTVAVPPISAPQFHVVTLYGYEPLADAALGIKAGRLVEIVPFAMLLLAFFAPAASMRMREPWRSGMQLIAAPPSVLILWAWTFVGTPQVGGLLALACWAVLLILSTVTLWTALRDRRRRGETA